MATVRHLLTHMHNRRPFQTMRMVGGLCWFVVLGVAMPIAVPGQSAAETAEVSDKYPAIDPALAVVLVRKFLAAVDNANDTGNYSVLHGLGADAFRASITVEDLALRNAALRQANIHLGSALLLQPEFTKPLVLLPGNVMTLEGFVPTTPMQTRFAFRLLWEGGMWKITDLGVAAQPAPQLSAPQLSVSEPAAKPKKPTSPKPKKLKLRPQVPIPTTKW